MGLAIGLLLAARAALALIVGGNDVFARMHTTLVVVIATDVCAH